MADNRRWIFSLLAGLLAALFVYAAQTGINWTVLVIVTVAGLLAYRRPDAVLRRAMIVPLGFAVLLAGALAVTANDFLVFIDLVMIASLLALSLLVARDASLASDYGAVTILTAPVQGLAFAVRNAIATSTGLVQSRAVAKLNPAARGALLALPVVIVFALLFASADPVFASGRDFVYKAVATWANVPRIVFGAAVALFVAGAYGASLPMPSAPRSPTPGTRAVEPIALTERGIVLAATAGICWLFVLLQIGYLFRADPASADSGVTFAQYARRGFGELAVAATIAVLVIVGAHNNLSAAIVRRRVRNSLVIPSLALLAAVACILVSAFNRVSLYENAYGYSTQRVYAQAYIVFTFAVLITLAWRVLRDFNVRALARNVMTVSLATFAFLVYWNTDAWVARANLDRFARTGKLDVMYLINGLSRDAHPAIVEALPQIPAPDRARLVTALAQVYGESANAGRAANWYDWNLRRVASQRALLTIGVPAP